LLSIPPAPPDSIAVWLLPERLSRYIALMSDHKRLFPGTAAIESPADSADRKNMNRRKVINVGLSVAVAWPLGIGRGRLGDSAWRSIAARYLLSQGARIDCFCAAMLGEREVVGALLAANPSVAQTRGPHGYTLLYHVAISGDVAMAELLKPHLAPRAGVYNQALSAAVRDGHLAMTRWLFENGDINPNLEDALGNRPLRTAILKGYQQVADELRRHGAREQN
jgi:hypothetical protein